MFGCITHFDSTQFAVYVTHDPLKTLPLWSKWTYSDLNGCSLGHNLSYLCGYLRIVQIWL